MENSLKLEYSKYKHLVNEADVLLFNHGVFLGLGWIVAKYTHSPYSHVALAHWHEDEVRCLEFREFVGSREDFTIQDYLDRGCKIDVFRATPSISIPYVDFEDPLNPTVEAFDINFDHTTAYNIIATAHKLLGRRYSWWTIWQFIKTTIPVIRLKQYCFKKNVEPDVTEFVCSTLISYTYRLNYVDPVSFLPDSYTTPGDLARSELFVKLFEII
jgi:hypothetical protein